VGKLSELLLAIKIIINYVVLSIGCVYEARPSWPKEILQEIEEELEAKVLDCIRRGGTRLAHIDPQV
jgi:hypothetical protein